MIEHANHDFEMVVLIDGVEHTATGIIEYSYSRLPGDPSVGDPRYIFEIHTIDSISLVLTDEDGNETEITIDPGHPAWEQILRAQEMAMLETALGDC
jgi:hypothetical protein